MIAHCLLFFAAMLPAQTPGPAPTATPPAAPAPDPAGEPVDEAALVREMEELQDRSGPVPEQRRLQYRKLVQKGVKAHDAGDYEKAVELHRRALALDPAGALAYYELAFSQAKLGRNREALENAVRAVTLDPKQEASYILKANLLDDLGFAEAAIATYRKLIEVQPSSYMAYLNLGVALRRKGDVAGAQRAFETARDLDPAYPSAYYHLAALARELGHSYREEEYLKRFLERGEEDPRSKDAKERLEQLHHYEVQLDPAHPYPDLVVVELGVRVTWRSQRHRERFPDAAGYEPTWEEEREVADAILALWREKKAQDPRVREARYDVLLRAADRGLLDEYLWLTRRGRLGSKAENWLAEHRERVEALGAWAREQGLADVLDPPPAPQAELPTVAALLERFEGSRRLYKMGLASPQQSGSLLEAEAERFRGAGPRDPTPAAGTEAAFEGHDLPACIRRLGRSQPGSVEWSVALADLEGLGLAYRDLRPDIQGGVSRHGDAISIHVPERQAWLPYQLAKAAWSGEEDLRASFGAPGAYVPDAREEEFAFGVLGRAYREARTLEAAEAPEDKGKGKGKRRKKEAPAPEPSLEPLADIEALHHLRGYVLFEVLHKVHGLSLASLGEADARAVDQYLRAHVLVPRQGAAPR